MKLAQKTPVKTDSFCNAHVSVTEAFFFCIERQELRLND